ncbi:AAA family ATPase [Ancylobacter terrae]|uniref:AAA family ATPase n=1 Tax=Ancylobacter sp. sgz301288 TaxID=3342077 RepID=UPI00385F7D30
MRVDDLVPVAVMEREQAERRRRFPLVPFADIALSTAPSYLVRGLLCSTGLAVIWGAAKCGKSFWLFDLLMHVTLGWPYRGRKVRQGLVVYLCLEGASGFRARKVAFEKEFLRDYDGDVPFLLVATSLDLIREHSTLITDIRASLGELRPAVVAIDTLNRSLAGSESDDKDMPAYIRAAGAIERAFGCLVAIVHHSGLDGTRPRGHTSLLGAADVQIAVKRDAADQIVTTVEYAKDGPADDTTTSRLRVVEVGVDDEGDPITSCVIEPAEQAATPERGAALRLSKGARIALDALREAIGDMGQPAPASNHIPPQVRVVNADNWRQYFYRKTPSDSETPRARQLAFKRAAEALQASSVIGVWDELVWIAR